MTHSESESAHSEPPPALTEAPEAAAPSGQTTARERVDCDNCGAPMAGPYCARCGQPTRHFVRFFPAVAREIAEDTLGVDSRFWRTLAALLFRPGRLTLDYFAGRRVRYTPPFRLYLFTSIVAFLLITVAIDEKMEAGEVDVVQSTAEAEAGGERFTFFGDTPFDRETNPVEIAWLPGFLNRRLNNEIDDFITKWPEIKRRPRLIVDEILGVMPQVIFVLLPLYALLLKFCYLFSRRLYMEHLIFAVHNHAFVFLVLGLSMVITLFDVAQDGGSSAAWSEIGRSALGTWLVIYLFLAQKRVYRQGWILTALKYFVIGVIYSIVLSIAFVAATLIGAVAV